MAGSSRPDQMNPPSFLPPCLTLLGVPLGIHPSMCWVFSWSRSSLRKTMSRGSPKPPDGGRDYGKAVKLQPPHQQRLMSQWSWGETSCPALNSFFSAAAPEPWRRWGQHCKPAKASYVPFQHTPLCLPPQNQCVGNKENGARPDLIWSGTQPGDTWSTTVPGGSDSPGDWANGIWKKEPKWGKRKGGSGAVAPASL